MMLQYSLLNIEPIYGPSLKGDVQRTLADINSINEKLYWKPSIMIKDWLKDIISLRKFNEV